MPDAQIRRRSPSPVVADDLGIVDALVQLSFRVQTVLLEAGSEHGLSISQIRLLGIVRDRDAGMLELAKHLQLDKSSVTGLVDRAERRGLVIRSTSPEDGRAVQVSATGHGREVVATVEAAVGESIARLTTLLLPKERVALSRLATAVVRGGSR